MLRISIGAADITPPVGVVGRLGWEHTLELPPHPCMAKVLRLKSALAETCSGPTSALQVCCEVVGRTRGVAARTRAELRKKLRVTEEIVMLSVTHTHCSPWLWNLEDEAARREGIELADHAYLEALLRGA